jgi:hypothetical protein
MLLVFNRKATGGVTSASVAYAGVGRFVSLMADLQTLTLLTEDGEADTRKPEPTVQRKQVSVGKPPTATTQAAEPVMQAEATPEDVQPTAALPMVTLKDYEVELPPAPYHAQKVAEAEALFAAMRVDGFYQPQAYDWAGFETIFGAVAVREQEPNDTWEQAIAFALGQTVEGELEPSGRDRWKFSILKRGIHPSAALRSSWPMRTGRMHSKDCMLPSTIQEGARSFIPGWKTMKLGHSAA